MKDSEKVYRTPDADESDTKPNLKVNLGDGTIVPVIASKREIKKLQAGMVVAVSIMD